MVPVNPGKQHRNLKFSSRARENYWKIIIFPVLLEISGNSVENNSVLQKNL